MSWRSSTLAANLTGLKIDGKLSLEISVIQSPCYQIHSLNYIIMYKHFDAWLSQHIAWTWENKYSSRDYIPSLCLIA